MFKPFLVIILWSCFLTTVAASDGAIFKSEQQEEGIHFYLQGSGAKRVLFVKVFVAGLYLGKGASAADVLTDVPKKLEVVYSQHIPAAKLAKETRQRIRLNVGEKEYSRLKSRIDRMDDYFVNIKPGDRYALTYVPGTGTKFTYNGRLVGTIEGADFAKGLFAVWVGERPVDVHLKAKLLGIR